MDLRLIHLLMAFFLVVVTPGGALPNMAKNSSSEISFEDDEIAPTQAHPVAVLEDDMAYHEGKVPRHLLTTRNISDPVVGRQKRFAWTGEIYETHWIPDPEHPRNVLLIWTGEGDLYDLLIYSGYPVAGGPGLPLYRSVRGLYPDQGNEGSSYMLRNLQRYSDYLVHIRARKSDGREGGWISFPRIITR